MANYLAGPTPLGGSGGGLQPTVFKIHLDREIGWTVLGEMTIHHNCKTISSQKTSNSWRSGAGWVEAVFV
jgi:hypothetical protein